MPAGFIDSVGRKPRRGLRMEAVWGTARCRYYTNGCFVQPLIPEYGNLLHLCTTCISVSCHLCPAMLAIIARCASTVAVDTVSLECGSSVLRPCCCPDSCAAQVEARMVSIDSALQRHSDVKGRNAEEQMVSACAVCLGEPLLARALRSL